MQYRYDFLNSRLFTTSQKDVLQAYDIATIVSLVRNDNAVVLQYKDSDNVSHKVAVGKLGKVYLDITLNNARF